MAEAKADTNQNTVDDIIIFPPCPRLQVSGKSKIAEAAFELISAISGLSTQASLLKKRKVSPLKIHVKR